MCIYCTVVLLTSSDVHRSGRGTFSLLPSVSKSDMSQARPKSPIWDNASNVLAVHNHATMQPSSYTTELYSTAFCKMVVAIVIRLTTHLWTLTPLWRAKQIPSRRCHGSYTNEKGICSLFTRRVPVETTPHNPPFEILTVSVWHLLDGICLAHPSGVKGHRWVEWQSQQPFCKPLYKCVTHYKLCVIRINVYACCEFVSVTLAVSPSDMSIFLAARSLWMKPLQERYFIPATMSLVNFSKRVFTSAVSSCLTAFDSLYWNSNGIKNLLYTEVYTQYTAVCTLST